MANSKPRVIWQDSRRDDLGGYRIVRHGRGHFVIESLFCDEMGKDSWRPCGWLDVDPKSDCMGNLPHRAMLSILEKLSRRRRRRKAARASAEKAEVRVKELEVRLANLHEEVFAVMQRRSVSSELMREMGLARAVLAQKEPKP